MSTGLHKRIYGSVKLGTRGNSAGISLPKDLREKADQYDNIPSEIGDDVDLILEEDQRTGTAELKLVKTGGN